MRKLKTIEQKIEWASFLVKLESVLRKPENEKYLVINGKLRRVM